MIGLTQLVQYLVVCKIARLTPGELHARISGATGHSQGLVFAVVLAASGTFESFLENSCKALKWLFYSGRRGQHAFPVVSVEPSLVQDSVNGGEGVPSPMLSITRLNLDEVESHITTTNAHLPNNSHLHVSLHRSRKSPRLEWVGSKQKYRFHSGSLFSQSASLLWVSFITARILVGSILEDLEEESWEPEDLKIPVFSTEDGNCSLFSPSI